MAVILYVSSTAIHGGAEEVLLDLMQAAGEVGHRPVLATPGEGWLTECARDRGIATELVPILPEAMTTVSGIAQFLPILPAATAIARLARRHGAAIVHSNAHRTSYHGGLAARLAGVKAVTHCHDIVGTPYPSPWKARLLDRLADQTIVVSDATGAALLRNAPRFRERLTTIHHAFREEAMAPVAPAAEFGSFRPPPGSLVIGTASAMTPWKGQDVLVDAFSLFQRDHPRAFLVIVGGSQGSTRQNDYESRLHARVAELGLGDRVIFTGWREDWRSLVAAFDIFVHAPTQPDPLPRVVIHAAALGRAVVATNTGGIPEIIGDDGDSGLLVPPGNAPALAAALVQLLADPSRRATMGERARKRVRIFSWDRMTTGLARVYSRLLGA